MDVDPGNRTPVHRPPARSRPGESGGCHAGHARNARRERCPCLPGDDGPKAGGASKTVEAYRALEHLLAEGRVPAIGVSNFMPEHLAALLDQSSVVPSVNQVEVHPYFTQPGVQKANAEHSVLTQAWSPMGGITSYRGNGHSTFDDPVIAQVAAEHGKTPAQVMLRWHLQEGRSAIPKSVN